MTTSGFAKPTDDDKAWFAGLLPEDPDVSQRPMFGNLAGFVRGNMFLCLFGSMIAARLSEPDRAELLVHDGAQPFAPMPDRPMKEYVVLPAAWRDEPDRAAEWIDRSLAYVKSLPPKAAKPARKKPATQR
jgi:TfoX/Sxy family transcriptional regulator of competence genes